MPIPCPKLILKSHDLNKTGFVNGKIELDCGFSQTIEDVLNNFNKYRSPSNQIKTLYNINGTQLTKNVYGLKIKENTTLFVDN